MLSVQNLHAFYGKSHVLHGVTLNVQPGEIVSLLGRNGSGRSTTLKSIMGLVDARGSVQWRAREVLGLEAFEVAHAGVGYVPESRDVFERLTVRQNLLLGAKAAAPAPGSADPRGKTSVVPWRIDDMFQMFPRLKEREHTLAGVMSGGEQQMLTLCRTLMGNPQLIMVDEPTEGLAPKIVEQVAQYLKQIQQRGVAVLLVEQKLTIALAISQRCYVMGHGRVVFEGSPAELRGNAAVRREWLEV